MPFIILFIFIFSILSEPSNSLPWDCEKETWIQEPELTDGVFTATIASTCLVHLEKESGIAYLFERLQKEYQRTEKYEIHEGPSFVEQGTDTLVSYDLTDKLNEEGSDLAIRQNVKLKTDQKKFLIYNTQSTTIKASGTAAYLRSVSFETEIKGLAKGYQIKLKNQVEIEQPWFAIGFLFKPMSASITKDKFIKARNKLIHYLLPDSL